MRILFVGTEISLKNSPEGIISRAILEGFIKNGCKVDLVSPRLPDSIEGLSQHFSYSAKENFVVNKLYKKVTGFEGGGFFDYCCKLIGDMPVNEYDMVFIRSDPVSLHRLALLINTKFGKRCVCSFGDVGSVNPYYSGGLLTSLRKKNLANLERKVVAGGNIITQTNQRSIDLYREAGFDVSRFCVLPNPIVSTVDRNQQLLTIEELAEYPDPIIQCYESVVSTASVHKQNVAFIGSFYGERKPDAMLDFFAGRDDVALHIFGGVRNILFEKNGIAYRWMRETGLANLANSAEKKGVKNFYVWPFMPITLINSLVVNQFDGLINVDADFKPNPFLSSKVVQYLGYNKSIFNFSNEGATVDLLKEAGIEYFIDYSNPLKDARPFSEICKISRPMIDLADYYSRESVVQRFMVSYVRENI
ncbi:hypothetical protein C4J87_1568 [Pseudomonas sp. R1-43-08]|uniref:hypothetical protein n=1 Tax=Pseudomonas sp. R1-43-08 TaxID=1173270 RepID=UPI000F563849|nr:hypothetical protein [Pseudomonas sp. R1-43-08]AZF41741.1 hypothetical protein C4J87_1568 [Pseudomonas sp. R1-43-08]